MSVSRVLVAGAAGQLGTAVVEAFRGREVIAHTRATLDVADDAAVRAVIAATRPELVVNCTSFNDVDGAEARPIEAFTVNAFAVRSLARAAADAGATLVHYSTDFVFDGTASTPYEETAAPAPRSTYAASKLTGEWFALDAGRAFVLRVESLFGTGRDWNGRRGTIDGLLAGLEAGRRVRVFVDRTVSPSYVADVAAATRHLVDRDAHPGLYHCVNSGYGTWDDVARELARLLGVEPLLDPITMAEVSLVAQRPRYCALANGKLAAAGYAMPSWQNALARWLATRGAPGDSAGGGAAR